MFLRALWGKEFTREANMESHIPLQTPAKSKNETAQRRDQEIGDKLLPGGSRAAEKQGDRTGYQSRRTTPSPSD